MFLYWAWGSDVGINSITDGTSNTLMAGEQIRKVTQWNAWVGANALDRFDGNPPELQAQERSWVARGRELDITSTPSAVTTPAVQTSAMADGSVKFLKSTINFNIYQALSTRANGEIVSADSF